MLLVWAHVSIAWGLYRAFDRSMDIWATTLQVFSKSPRGRSIPNYTPEHITKASEQRISSDQQWWIIHSNYLANLSKELAYCESDIKSIIHDFDIAQQTWFDAVNVHIGKLKWCESRDSAFTNMANNVEFILNHNRKKWFNATYLFENTAWQWSELWSTIEELWYFYRNYIKGRLPVKFCIDTAHCRWGGVDVTDIDAFLWSFDEHVGLDAIYSFHLNDSRAILGSHLDRHAPLGRGFIWRQWLTPLIQRAAANNKPIIIETPKPELRKEEVSHVKDIVNGHIDRVWEYDSRFMKTDILKKFQTS